MCCSTFLVLLLYIIFYGLSLCDLGMGFSTCGRCVNIVCIFGMMLSLVDIIYFIFLYTGGGFSEPDALLASHLKPVHSGLFYFSVFRRRVL